MSFSKQASLPYCFPPHDIRHNLLSGVRLFNKGQASPAASYFNPAVNPEGKKYKADYLSKTGKGKGDNISEPLKNVLASLKWKTDIE